MFKGLIMYKVEIDISAWGGDEKVTIETHDFEKVQLIQEFIEAQQDAGWEGDFIVFDDDEEAEEESEAEEEKKEEEDEPMTISTLIIQSASF